MLSNLSRTRIWLCWLVLASGANQSQRCCAVDAVVVRPSVWKAAVQPWKTYRESQGLVVQEIDSEIGQRGIQTEIRRLYAENKDRLRFVLLAGDVGQHKEICIPTFYRTSAAMVKFGGDASIATDSPYADMDDDEIPDLAIGRIPADSEAQLSDALRRSVNYERNRDFSQWRRDVHVVAGVGGFGVLADSVIEMTTRRFLADRIPGWSDVSMTQASTSSHYCPDPWRFSEACIDRFNAGGTFWVYIGHGHVKTLDYLRTQQGLLPILNSGHVPAVQTGQNSPIAIFLACYTGAFDATEDSLAEELVMQGQGPVAAIAASRVSGPYGLAMLSHGLLENFYSQRRSTLGEIILHAKSEMLAQNDPGEVGDEDGHAKQGVSASDSQLQMIGAIAAALSPEGYDLRQERLEHVWQVNLLGDPLLRINYPTELPLEAPARTQPGEMISVRGASQATGKLTVEFAFRRDQIRRELDEQAGDLNTQAGRDLLQRRYLAANNRVIVCCEGECEQGLFERDLEIPEDMPAGRYCIRAFIEGENLWQVGYSEISVRQPRR